MASAEYPKTAVNKLGRLANRGAYDFATIHTLINTCPVLHVSFADPTHPFPITLPMLGCTGSFPTPSDPITTAQDLYIHGHIASRLFASGKATSTPGLPITVAATFLDGLVLALAPFHNSCNYRSAIAYGYASPVTDEAEALYAMQLITDNMLPGRWARSRNPPTGAELKSTGILKVSVVSASAKVRDGGPKDDRKDLGDKTLVGGTWTGVVPFWGTWGEGVPSGYNACHDEGYIEEWRVRETGKARDYAFGAVEK